MTQHTPHITYHGLLLGATSDTESATLEAYQDALAWALGMREESPSQKGA